MSSAEAVPHTLGRPGTRTALSGTWEPRITVTGRLNTYVGWLPKLPWPTTAFPMFLLLLFKKLLQTSTGRSNVEGRCQIGRRGGARQPMSQRKGSNRGAFLAFSFDTSAAHNRKFYHNTANQLDLRRSLAAHKQQILLLSTYGVYQRHS